MSGYDGSVGLDATVVPLYSRGPSKASSTCASDPDGGWYVRDGDHRDEEDHKGRRRSKVFWALEATIATMARQPGAAPRHPNLAVGLIMARPGEDPGGVGVRVLASLASRGYKPGFLGADRGYTQVLPSISTCRCGPSDTGSSWTTNRTNSAVRPTRAGRFSSTGASTARRCQRRSCRRAGTTVQESSTRRRSPPAWRTRSSYRLVRKSGPDNDGYERYSCPAVGGHPHVVCPLRPTSSAAVGKIPVLSAPLQPPKVYTQQAITIAPNVGTPPPGADVRDRGMGPGLCDLPQHDRGLERLCERRRPRGPRRAVTATHAWHRRPEHLLRFPADGRQPPQDQGLPRARRRHAAPARVPSGQADGE